MPERHNSHVQCKSLHHTLTLAAVGHENELVCLAACIEHRLPEVLLCALVCVCGCHTRAVTPCETHDLCIGGPFNTKNNDKKSRRILERTTHPRFGPCGQRVVNYSLFQTFNSHRPLKRLAAVQLALIKPPPWPLPCATRVNLERIEDLRVDTWQILKFILFKIISSPLPETPGRRSWAGPVWRTAR